MYTRIDLAGLAGSALTRGTELQLAVDQANAAHALEPSPPGSAAHVAIDRELQRRVIHIESLIKGSTYSHSAALRAQLTSARDQLRNHLVAAGQSPQPLGEPQTSLSQRIAELPDAVAERLANVLVTYKGNQGLLAANLRTVFPFGSDPAAVARWRDFLDTHTITFLGGSNIINFKVTAVLPLVEPPEVLKLEYRFGYASRMDTVLRTAIPQLCTPTAVSRMVRAPDNTGAPVGRSLMVTTLCTNGGAGGYAKRGRLDYIVAAAAETAATMRAAGRAQIDIDTAVTARINLLTHGMSGGDRIEITHAAAIAVNAAVLAVAANPLAVDGYRTAATTAATALRQRIHGVASQMCARFQDLEREGIYFPDAKLDNWVVEGDGTLRVADTKSFKRSPPDVVNEGHVDNEGIVGRIRTRGFNLGDIDANRAPEIIHRAILGRNIYYALTGVWPHDTTRPACTEEVFQGAVGAKYKSLIEGLTHRTAPAPGIPQPTITLAQAAQTLREINIMHAPAYALATVPQQALMVALAANPAYAAANAGQQALMVELAASAGYEAASPAQRLLMAALATNPSYESASPAQRMLAAALSTGPEYEAANPAQRSLMVALAVSPVYEAASPTQRALVAALARSPVYETASPSQKTLVVTLAASAGYEAATPDQRALMVELAAKPIYEAAAPAQRALMIALATNATYEAANPAQRTFMAALASKPLYEAAAPATRQRMLDAMVTPAYAAIVAKMQDLEAVTGQDHTSSLHASLHAACAGLAYDRDTALATLRDTVNRAYDTLVEANTLRAAITTPVQPGLGGQVLLPDALLVNDRVTLIAAAADLNALLAGLEAHRAHLTTARDALPELRGLQGLSDACNAQRFGDGDARMDQFLARARQDILDGATLVARLGIAHRVHGELTAARAGLCDAVNQSVHDNITRLRGKYFSRGAGAKATAIENAAAAIPIPSRISLRAHEGDLVVQAMFNEMGRSRSIFSGLGAVSAKPDKIESYKLAMKALRPDPPRDEREHGKAGRPPTT
ncbi:hypothetical protein GH742_08975 [Legionella sp. MW5194]|uniref:hypothetical protein n=1 Tax=Legionella sp. MW5194 TaxID=2662448 RepID=UPI00193C91CD|nr:hypothetical protein [Legionella sp. MW5194]QRN03989.1 hypothetical protein GH742_08975 [Legionella sp. MW5194]